MKSFVSRSLLGLSVLSLSTLSQADSVTLYDQNFESPNDPPDFIDGSGSDYDDLSQQTVNSLYGGQPAGFSFAQSFTVETVWLTGPAAFGSGYSDPSGIGGNYAIGMLSDVQNDLLGLSFNIGDFDFFNFTLDISSLGLSGGPGNGPFADETTAPVFQFTLFDNPTGASGVGTGLSSLDQETLAGSASALNTLDWTNGVFALDASGSTNGNVLLQIDLLEGGYAVMDNIKITASDEAGGGLAPVPLPAAAWLFGSALIGAGIVGRRKKKEA